MTAAAPPGIRFAFEDTPHRRILPVRSDIAGMVGFAERGPPHRPVVVESWRQYEAVFGGFGTAGYLPYAVRAFFENGGRTAYVVRVTAPPARTDGGAFVGAWPAFAHLDVGGGPAVRVEARTPGRWGNRIAVTVTPEVEGRVTLVVRTEGRTWRLPSVQPADLRAGSAPTGSDLPVVFGPARPNGPASASRVRLRGGRDGIERCDLRHLLGGDDEASAEWGLGALAAVDQVALLVVPDAQPFPSFREQARPPRSVPCAVEQDPDPDAGRFMVPEEMMLADVARRLAVDPMRIRATNQHLQSLADGDLVSAGTVVIVPRGVGAVAGDPMVPFPAGLNDPGQAAAELGAIAAAYGLAVSELLAANPAFCPAVYAPGSWQPPEIPLVVPAPPAEEAPQWSADHIADAAKRLIHFCEVRRDCVALLDVPVDARTPAAALAFRVAFDSSFAGMAWPWITVRRGTSKWIDVPPSGALAGLTAAADVAFGPHRSPAGSPVAGAVALTASATDPDHGLLNVRGVNVLRERAGRGVIFEGARSLSSDPTLRQLNVRRTLLVIAESLDEQTQWAVHEPNGPRLWADVRDAVRSFLTDLWRRGWLSGARADDAFYVRCDDLTNPEAERDMGRVLVVVGLRIPPAVEWIEVRITRSLAGVSVEEVA